MFYTIFMARNTNDWVTDRPWLNSQNLWYFFLQILSVHLTLKPILSCPLLQMFAVHVTVRGSQRPRGYLVESYIHVYMLCANTNVHHCIANKVHVYIHHSIPPMYQIRDWSNRRLHSFSGLINIRTAMTFVYLEMPYVVSFDTESVFFFISAIFDIYRLFSPYKSYRAL